MKGPYAMVAAIIAILMLTYFGFSLNTARQNELKIFHAGSLTGLVEDVGDLLDERYSIKVLNEPSGSIDAIRKVVDLGKRADLVMVSDYRLIERLMMPNYTSWVLAFASNEMVIAYTNSSKFSDKINEDNWLEIISMPGVKVGLPDPNRDPCGYRSLMVLALAYLQEKDERAIKILEKVGNVRVEQGSILVDVSQGVSENVGNLVFREKEIDLVALLESGILDYAFEYRNVALAHGLRYIELPKEVNLSTLKLDELYEKVSVRVLGAGEKAVTIPAKSITYGLTIPKVAENIDGAKEFCELLLSNKEILERNGFRLLKNPVIIGEAPEWLKEG